MVHEHCFFCKLRPTVQLTSVRDSIKSSNLELVVMDDKYMIAKCKGSFEQSALPSFVSRLKNSMLFTQVNYARKTYVGKA